MRVSLDKYKSFVYTVYAVRKGSEGENEIYG